MKIYTKTGDNGETGLSDGSRVRKDHLRLEAYGTVDELNSIIGCSLCELKSNEVAELLADIQNDLFVMGSDLSMPLNKGNKKDFPRISESDWLKLEQKIDYFDSKLPRLSNFIIPGGSKGSSHLHLARTVCRRVERHVVALSNTVEIGNNILIYLNRLSDLLFVLARFENSVNSAPDIIWKKRG